MTVTGISTFRGDVQVADKIVHLDDSNTAIRFPAADTFSVEALILKDYLLIHRVMLISVIIMVQAATLVGLFNRMAQHMCLNGSMM